MAKPDNYHPLVRAVARDLRKRCNVKPGSSIVVACSGGADSIALLRALAILAERRSWRLRLIVGHVHHHLREEAEEDAAFVEQLAKQLGLTYARRDIDPASKPGNLEANARHLRYQALAEIAGEHDAPIIATAHHADDQLETMLMRMLRGSSVAGLRGILWCKLLRTKAEPGVLTPFYRVVRPMLAVEQEAIESFLKQLDQPWREDTTNADTTRTRAKLRHEVVPLLKQLQADAAQKANAMADHFRDLDGLVHRTVEDVMRELVETDGEGRLKLERRYARSLNPVTLGELLRGALIGRGVSPGHLTRPTIMSIVTAAQDTIGKPRTFEFNPGVTLKVDRDALRITKA